MTFGIIGLLATLRIIVSGAVMMSVAFFVMLSIIMLSIIMLSAITLNAIMLSIVVPLKRP